MTNKQTLLSLAKECEGMTEPCREMDAKIAIAFKVCKDFDINGYKPEVHHTVRYIPYDGRGSHEGWVTVIVADMERVSRASLNYTASIDAAIGTVPEGLDFSFFKDSVPDTNSFYCELREVPNGKINKPILSHAATLPLAILAASLRARASEVEG